MVTSPTSSALTPPARSNVAGWTSPGRFWIWGGLTGGTTSSFSSSGASYDPAADAWMMMDASKSPAARHDATVVSTGNAAIVWGGQGESTFFNDGSVFVP
jgi:N-acetylneuraminic acid mutarotase